MESAVYTSRGVDSLGRQALRETSGAGPLFAAGPSLVHKDKIIFISRRRTLASKCWFLMMIQESLLECRFFYIQSLIEFGEYISKMLRGVVSD